MKDIFESIKGLAGDGPEKARKMTTILIIAPLLLLILDLATGIFTNLYFQTRIKTLSALNAEARVSRELGGQSVSKVVEKTDLLLSNLAHEVMTADNEMRKPLERCWRLTKRFWGGALLWFGFALLGFGQTTKWKHEPTGAEKQEGLRVAQGAAWLGVLSGLLGIVFNGFENLLMSFIVFPLIGGLGGRYCRVFLRHAIGSQARGNDRLTAQSATLPNQQTSNAPITTPSPTTGCIKKEPTYPPDTFAAIVAFVANTA